FANAQDDTCSLLAKTCSRPVTTCSLLATTCSLLDYNLLALNAAARSMPAGIRSSTDGMTRHARCRPAHSRGRSHIRPLRHRRHTPEGGCEDHRDAAAHASHRSAWRAAFPERDAR